MCGIAGIYAYRASAEHVNPAELRTIRDHMARRGPDGSGEWISADHRIGFGHRRLAIIDLSDRASQPMQTHDGRLTVTFNGEIYNHVALREELQAKGYVFQTTSDTEVLLHLYRDRGVQMLQALRGMYAIGLWDATAQSLLLARDPYGIKPLYYSDEAGTLRFGSQVRALLAGGGISSERDSAGQVGFYLWGSVPEPHTTYRSIKALQAGSYLVADRDGVHAPQSHFSIAKCWSDACENIGGETPSEEAQARVRAALIESVRNHLVADVPVSAFLSGGIDSGSLLGLMTEQGQQTTHAITLSFAEFSGRTDDEVPLAAAVALHYGVQHQIRRVDRTEFREDLPAILAAMDQPTIDGVNTWFVSKATSELGLKVAISGLGGDELFGGYATFQEVPRIVRAMYWPARVPGLGESVRRAAGSVLGSIPRAHPKLAGLAEYGGSYPGAYMLKRGLFMPWELDAVLPADMVRDGLARLAPAAHLEALLSPMPRSDWAKVAVLEASQYMRNQLLRDTDWASMAHSLEVRVPLVDHVLLAKLAPIIASSPRVEGKRWLAMSPHRALPQHVRDRAKTGFSTPVEDWLQSSEELAAWRRVPQLAKNGCPWARRFAYAVSEGLGTI
jgi:asparagine synthase (glutamine-hydrolysing)